jgi:predicted nucleic acid-binding protein
MTVFIEHYLLWNVIDNTASLLRTALDIQQRYQLSFWDSNIIAAARSAGAKELWTEDLNNGQRYEGILAVNPFK